MIILYFGHGKGKTSACLGQALRALGHRYRVAFGQYIKRPNRAGEQSMLKRLLREDFFANGCGFVKNATDLTKHRAAAQAMLAWAEEKAEHCWLLIIDEALYALEYGLLSEQDLRHLCGLCRTKGCHLVLSGRTAPPWLLALSDTATRLEEEKHPFASGGKAVLGIDY
ncbi:MAG: cob(I)yrinic acid a,c-diamide adenosyltransferase [Desulfovibrio sp.]|nr:cob(I)yrinic acid a,c-diamide adenosyltransferase [Desulfovibrio sp.]